MKEWDQCLLMLGDAKVDEHGDVYDTKDCNVMYLDKDSEDREINVSFFFLMRSCSFSCLVVLVMLFLIGKIGFSF